MVGIGVHVCEGCGGVYDTIGVYLTCREGHPRRCPCGHVVGDLRCLNGRVYGPCGEDACIGPCTDTHGYCQTLNGCCDEENNDE